MEKDLKIWIKNELENMEKFKVKNRYFLEDAKNKTITYNLSNKTEEDLLNSFQKHLPRIYDKYKEYKKRRKCLLW